MKKTFRFQNITLIITIILLVFGAHYFFLGTPWGRYMSTKMVTKYIENKFSEEYNIVKINYDFKYNTYDYFIYLRDRKDLIFKITSLNKVRQFKSPPFDADEGFADNLFIVFWENEITNNINNFIKSMEYDNFFEAIVAINENPVYNNYKEGITLSQIPTYLDIKNMLKRNSFWIHINIKVDLHELDLEKEIIKLFDIINFIKIEGYEMGQMFFQLTEEGKSKRININHDEMENIENINDLLTIFLGTENKSTH
ncbi:UNVERIFIED_CONTAM: hypothetical protein Cloal_1105 [Acetivibrio alkalicellulosi]